MKIDKLMCVILLLVLATSGCSYLRTPTQCLTVTTDQPDTEVFVNGAMVGQGGTISVERNQDVYIIARKEGYITVQRRIGTSLNTTGKIDTIGSILLFPLIGVFSSGARSLDEKNVSITMVKR